MIPYLVSSWRAIHSIGNKRLLLCVSLIFCAHSTQHGTDVPKSSCSRGCIGSKKGTQWDQSPYLNTAFLQQNDQVKKALKKEQFTDGFFQATDGTKISYLFLKRPKSTHTVICCSGFMPGRKEGAASFYALLPATSNILLFDARGHGESEGSFIRATVQLGVHEYKDIIGAIQFVYAQDQKPIFLLGICAGAFHAIHALLHLEKEKKGHSYPLAGLIFDSGWGSVSSVAQTAPSAHIADALAQSYASLAGCDKKDARETLTVKGLDAFSSALWYTAHMLVVTPLFALHEKETNIFDKIQNVNIPIFFIHSHDDTYVNIKNAQQLAQRAPCATTWWIDAPSTHACHHLKHSAAYQEQIGHFIETQLAL